MTPQFKAGDKVKIKLQILPTLVKFIYGTVIDPAEYGWAEDGFPPDETLVLTDTGYEETFKTDLIEALVLPEPENDMKSLKKNLQDLTGENIDLQKELPEIGLDDLNIIDTKTFGEEITLWLCNDEDRNRYIIRDDSAGLRGICLFSSRDDQLTFAAWNVDFDITALTDWIDDETMTLDIEDAKAHHWEFSGPFNSRSPR